jgi:diketogulonate reductase-like aldo/keto reductase
MLLVRQLLDKMTVSVSIRGIIKPTARTMASSASNHSTSRLHHERPAFIYGTAWKKDHTKSLVRQALMAGFRRVDTAAQPRHYQEHLVGEALREAYSEGIAKRDDLYVRKRYARCWYRH